MTGKELEKLTESEREDFVRLYHTAPDEMTSEEMKRLDGFASKINVGRYAFEILREEAAKPQERYCTLTSRNPYKITICYGELELPDRLVPQQLRELPGNEYFDDTLLAIISADTDTMTITSFVFKEYLKKSGDEEVANFFGVDSAPEGKWPRRQK